MTLWLRSRYSHPLHSRRIFRLEATPQSRSTDCLLPGTDICLACRSPSLLTKHGEMATGNGCKNTRERTCIYKQTIRNICEKLREPRAFPETVSSRNIVNPTGVLNGQSASFLILFSLMTLSANILLYVAFVAAVFAVGRGILQLNRYRSVVKLHPFPLFLCGRSGNAGLLLSEGLDFTLNKYMYSSLYDVA